MALLHRYRLLAASISSYVSIPPAVYYHYSERPGQGLCDTLPILFISLSKQLIDDVSLSTKLSFYELWFLTKRRSRHRPHPCAF